MADERIVELEIRVAEQEQTILELNVVVTNQQSRLMQLEKLSRSIIDRLNDLSDGSAPDDETPPHY